MKILIIEDDRRLAAVVRRGLMEAGHVVDVEHDGITAVVRSIRTGGSATPILMLTSRDTAQDAISGLDAGADDYLRKPFVFGELHARLRSLSRRKAPPSGDVLRAGDLSLDRATREIRRGDTIVALTARETAFLEYFMQNLNVVLTPAMIERALWESDRDTISNLIRVYVRRLRVKLSPNGEPELIATIRGAGYRMSATPERV